MTKVKFQNKIFICALAVCCYACFMAPGLSLAQDSEIDFNIDFSTASVPLPGVFKPNIDLSGRGFYQDTAWPQELAVNEVLNTWKKEIGFSGLYRIQYNLWEISQLEKEKDLQEKLLANYEAVIKSINDAGGTVILDLFSTPPGLGKVLDKKSPPWDLKAFKEVVKKHIRRLSCKKKFNIWYEVWTAPDLDAFFLGNTKEYLEVYRAVAEGVKELEQETKIHIPVGGPSTSWWFQNTDGNTSLMPEKSLMYELIKFCAHYKLPLDFISWHAYSSDPGAEREMTLYNKISVALIRDWLVYFNLDKGTPLIVDEWNYDNGTNKSPERKEKSFVCASYIPSRLKNMYKAGLDYQLFFSLEDFQGNQEGIMRNVGVFWFEQNSPEYKGGNKSIFNAFRMLAQLDNVMLVPSPKPNDEFIDIIATRKQDGAAIMVYNYIDPEIFMNYVTRNISTLSRAESKSLLNLLKSDTVEKIKNKELDISRLRLRKRVKALLFKAQELNEQATKFMYSARAVKLNIKNMNLIKAGAQSKTKAEGGLEPEKEPFVYERYTIDSSCGISCEFAPVEEKDIDITAPFQETLTLNPYSVTMILIKKKPKVAEITLPVQATAPDVTTPVENKETPPKETVPGSNGSKEPVPAETQVTNTQVQVDSQAPAPKESK